MSVEKKVTYADVGDDYNKKDPLKIFAQHRAASTSMNLPDGITEVAASRGESAYIIDVGPFYLASTPEGLGTKNLISDEVYAQNSDKSFYFEASIDTVATIVNDLITVGAQPLVVSPHWAIGSNDWLDDRKRFEDLVNGWVEGCNRSGAVYGSGETPTLKDIVYPNTIELSGAAFGIISPKERLTLGEKLIFGDRIILIESSGIHTNGLSLARHISSILPDGYNTSLSDGRTFGEALLSPSHIYAKLQAMLFEKGVDIHAMVHLTGHGLRKLMRTDRKFTYRITNLPTPQDEFSLIQQVGNYSERDMYETFNMGSGFAFYVPATDALSVQRLAAQLGFKAWDAGVVEEGPKQVIIEPKNIVFSEKDLELR